MDKWLKEPWTKPKNMLITHTQKYIRMSPSKIRLVAFMVKKLSPQRAIEVLPFSQKRAADPVLKVLKTAMAIAKERGFSPEEVKIKEIQVGEGPRLKRGIAVSRGRWHPIVKKMSHIRVTLEVKDKVKESKVEDKAVETKDLKKAVKKVTTKKGTK
jgi:large subunit ribosomal protein L22